MTEAPVTSFGVPRLLTTEETAELLAVSTKTLGKLARAGDVPAVRVGTQWRFELQDVVAWIRKRKTGATGNTAPDGS